MSAEQLNFTTLLSAAESEAHLASLIDLCFAIDVVESVAPATEKTAQLVVLRRPAATAATVASKYKDCDRFRPPQHIPDAHRVGASCAKRSRMVRPSNAVVYLVQEDLIRYLDAIDAGAMNAEQAVTRLNAVLRSYSVDDYTFTLSAIYKARVGASLSKFTGRSKEGPRVRPVFRTESRGFASKEVPLGERIKLIKAQAESGKSVRSFLKSRPGLKNISAGAFYNWTRIYS